MDPHDATGRSRSALTLRILAGLGTVLTLVTLAMAAGDASAVLTSFTLWVVGPCLFVLLLSFVMPGPLRHVVAAVGLALCLLAGPAIYIVVALEPPDANGMLVAAVMPVWQAMGIGLVCAVAGVVHLARRKRAAQGGSR